jgi:predicted Zn-dependent protease
MRGLSTLFSGLAISLVCFSANAQLDLQLPTLPGNPPLNLKTGQPNQKDSQPNPADMLKQPQNIAQGIGEAEEIQIGQGFATMLLGARPMMANDQLQRYVNALGHYLALQTERPDLPWTFAVLDDAGFNAFSTPGGYIFVTRGLVQRMHNESELAGVLAHEIGHVLRKHYLKLVQTSGALKSTTSALDSAGGNSMLNLAKSMYSNGLDKEDEFEADRIGVVIAARAGYDPYGLPIVIQILREQSASDNNFSLLLKTHPAPTERLNRLDKLMRGRFDSFNGSVGAPIADRLQEY